MSPQRAERLKKFKKIGEAISKIGDPDVPDYQTGLESKFKMQRGDTHHRELHEVPLGPSFNTPQWVRTVK